MTGGPEVLLVGAVAAVGVLHTVVPDHWVPITLIARRQGWSKREVARAALVAGTGHTVSTLLIGLLVWIAGVAFATRFGNLVSNVSSVALIAFGAWIALSSLRELRTSEPHGHGHGHGHRDGDTASADATHTGHEHDHLPDGHLHTAGGGSYVAGAAGTALITKHEHAHRHGRSTVHLHPDDPPPETLHDAIAESTSEPPPHDHRHKRPLGTTLLLILGSSPMVEGIPAFFAAAKYGPALITVMSVVFALSTIATYVVLCVSSVAGLRRVELGPLERYGEVLSGAFIAAVGLVFLIFPVL